MGTQGLGSKVGSPLWIVLVRKNLIEKVTFQPIFEGDEGARPGHWGKDVLGGVLVLQIQKKT